MWAARTPLLGVVAFAILMWALIPGEPARPVEATPPPRPVVARVVAAPALPDSEADAECHHPARDEEFAELRGDERVLADAWREAHPCMEIPGACPHPDPVAVLRADVDAAPGTERAIADNRFGVLLLAANGDQLAAEWGSECGSWPEAGQHVRLEARRYTGAAHADLVLRTRIFGHCGEFPQTTVLGREDTYLATLATIDEEGERGCNVWMSRIRARITSPDPGVLAVRYDGYGRTSSAATAWEYGPRVAVHETCTVALVAGQRVDLDRDSCSATPAR